MYEITISLLRMAMPTKVMNLMILHATETRSRRAAAPIS
jgi:hypothetical protein